MRFLSIYIFFASVIFGFSIDVKNSNVCNGETVLVELKKKKNFQYEKIIFADKSYKIFKHPIDADKAYALIPISYYKKPSIEELKIQYKIKDVVDSSLFLCLS